MNDLYTAFDLDAPGILDADSDFTPEGAALFDAHLDRIDAALQAWAGAREGVAVEFTDSVIVTFVGSTSTHGGPDCLAESPAAWVAFAQEALVGLVSALIDAIDGAAIDTDPMEAFA